jgi:FtsP/CotA-like multicopper oxidase with cupredoxin domain
MRSAHSHETTVTAPDEVIVDLVASDWDWEVAPGRTVPAWTYNGQVPGPTIEATVGDTVVVRLTNRLDEPTTIHWHGVRLPAAMDGTQVVQPLVQPGETFEYRFTVPDAGTFWYHSHHNETEQMERGLYGALVVRDAGEMKVDRERVLMLDDMKLRRNGDFKRFGGWLEAHLGREGDVRLVNGRNEPTLEMAAGQVERWRVINASSARYILLSIGGEEFSIVGTGGGLVENPVAVRELLLVPGNRADIVVGPFAEGVSLFVNAMPYNRHTGKPRVERFASVRVGARRESVAEIPSRLRTIEPLALPTAAPNRVVTMSESINLRRGTDFKINGEMHHNDKPVMVGELQVWDVVNASHMDHPFHLHGFFFQVLSVNGEAPPFRSWQDTVNVPPKGTVRIAWMPDDRPGMWMYHCHILEHHAGGMMANFAVVRPGGAPLAYGTPAPGCHT